MYILIKKKKEGPLPPLVQVSLRPWVWGSSDGRRGWGLISGFKKKLNVFSLI